MYNIFSSYFNAVSYNNIIHIPVLVPLPPSFVCVCVGGGWKMTSLVCDVRIRWLMFYEKELNAMQQCEMEKRAWTFASHSSLSLLCFLVDIVCISWYIVSLWPFVQNTHTRHKIIWVKTERESFLSYCVVVLTYIYITDLWGLYFIYLYSLHPSGKQRVCGKFHL